MIWPVDPVIAAKNSGTAISLENRGPFDAVLQIRAMRWTQDGGEDRLTEDDSLVVSPPIIRIPSKGRQLVRLILADPAARTGEQSYRIFIDEVPASLEATDGKAASAIRFRMRYSIPLFAYSAPELRQAADAIAHDISCSLSPDRQSITIRNSGAEHARLTDVSLDAGGRARELSEGLFGYVLPASEMSWRLEDAAGIHASLRAIVNGGDTQVSLGECTQE